jgi:hypothetical protein
MKRLNKNAILFSIFVILCVVVIIVINFFINRPEEVKPGPDAAEATHAVISQQQSDQAQAPAPEEEQEPRPEYEATVSNGTILF